MSASLAKVAVQRTPYVEQKHRIRLLTCANLRVQQQCNGSATPRWHGWSTNPDERLTMAKNEFEKPDRHPDTWPGVVSRLLELVSDSWAKLIRVSIAVVVLCGSYWLITH